MKTRMIYFPNETNHDLEVTVDHSGDIISALGYFAILDEWVDVSARVARSSKWRERIAQRFGELDWTDDPRDLEAWIDPIDLIKEGLKQA